MKSAKHNTERLRRFCKWAAAAITVLLTMVWIGSGWHAVSIGSEYTFGVFDGRVVVMRDVWWNAPMDFETPMPVRVVPTIKWGFEYNPADRFPNWSILIPLWPCILVAAITTTLACRRDHIINRRPKVGACPHCAFNLSGLAPDAVCPECGKKA